MPDLQAQGLIVKITRSEAKRAACRRAASVLETALGDGWEELDMYGEDRPKVEAALQELIAELDRRGGAS